MIGESDHNLSILFERSIPDHFFYPGCIPCQWRRKRRALGVLRLPLEGRGRPRIVGAVGVTTYNIS